MRQIGEETLKATVRDVLGRHYYAWARNDLQGWAKRLPGGSPTYGPRRGEIQPAPAPREAVSSALRGLRQLLGARSGAL